ncbi:hypothetical protein [Planctomycetes bacterium K23_9]|uniref:Uncharacterized protein n=1 Tax=Stieleria marina TaxID=1930275 RepID=A0A517NQA8_9BACT|nr:hypothetical protein K239x_12540 [Planctomycetes bacterium K23_9]
MSTRHLSAVLLTLATSFVAASSADAGFGDWLFGRTPTTYAAGYAPTAVVPMGAAPVGVSPVAGYQAQMQTYDNPSVYTGRPVVSGYGTPSGYGANRTAYQLPPSGTVAPVSNWTPLNPAGSGYAANYGAQPTLPPAAAAPTPWAVTNTTVGPPVGAQPFNTVPTMAAPALSYRPSLVQPSLAQPAFGRPNVGGEVPIARALRGANTTSNPFYGTGNVYPNTFGAVPQPYAAGYGTSQITPAASLNGPVIDPLFPNAPRPRVGGLARFFGSLLGTNYQSSYYRAPITYYRPMTAVDPITGTTVTTQQACSSYVQQLQRTPYNSFQPGGGLLPGGFGNQGTTVTPIGPPMPCGSGGCGIAASPAPQPYGPNPYAANPGYAQNPNYAPAPNYGPQFDNSSSFDNQGAVGQVGGIDSPNDRDVIPIPSTEPRGGYYQQNTQPLTGRPESSARGTDQDNVGQPRLESARPRNDEDTYRDGLYRRDVTPYADEDFNKKEDVDQSSYYKSPIDDEPVDLNGPLGRSRYQAQPRYTPEPRQSREQSYTQLAPVAPPLSQPRAQQPVSRTEATAERPVAPAYSTLRPIPDPNPEPSPFRQRDAEANRVTQPSFDITPRYESKMPGPNSESPNSESLGIQAPSVRDLDIRAPKLPPATEQPSADDGWYKRGTANSASARVRVPVREANLSLKQFQGKRPSAPAKSIEPILRDTDGWLPL